MFTGEALAVDRPWRLEEVPPEVQALLGDDLACIADGDELDRGLILHLMYEAVYEQPEPETIEWVQAAIEARPGTWTARLCRASS